MGLHERIRCFAKAAAVVVVALGLLVLVAWVFELDRLLRLARHGPAMNPASAVAFIFSGVSLCLVSCVSVEKDRRLYWVGKGLALLVLLIGAVKLSDFLFGFGWHMDQWLFPGKLDRSIPGPNAMAPNSALSFVLVGLGLLLIDVRTRSGLCLAQPLAICSGVLSLLALVGYSYSVESFYRFGAAIPIALNSAIAFGALSLGILSARPEFGFMRLLASETTAGSTARRLLPMAILVPWILGRLRLAGERAGLYDNTFGVALFSAATIVIFGGLVWWNTIMLYVAEREQRRTAERLRKTTADLERSNTDLQQFAYVASHDLVEPLRMVISYLQLLKSRNGTKLDKQSEEFIGFAVDGAHRMQALIQGLLEYSRVEFRGRPFEPTDGEHVLNLALANLKVAIEESGAKIERDGALPKVEGDAVQLTQLFQNLIGNAIKFRGANPPTVKVGARPLENGMSEFFVQDRGIGIDPRNFERIFVIFQRLHTRAEYSGTGLGLAICKKIVERHGGRIWVESAAGEGAVFRFTLRRAERGERADES